MTVRATWAQAKNIIKILYIEAGRTSPDPDVLLLAPFDDGDARDISTYEHSPSVESGTPEFSDGKFVARNTVGGPGDPGDLITWTIDEIPDHANEAFCLEARVRFDSVLSNPSGLAGIFELIFGVGGANILRFGIYGTDNVLGQALKLVLDNGSTVTDSTNTISLNQYHHIALQVQAGSGSQTARVYVDGVLWITGTSGHALGPGTSFIRIGPHVAGNKVNNWSYDFVRMKLGVVYSGTKTNDRNFEPPASLPDPRGVIGSARFVERAVQFQNLANIQSRGGEIAGEVIPFRGISNAATANLVAPRVSRR